MAARMSVLSALSAAGRFRVTRPAALSWPRMTSGVESAGAPADLHLQSYPRFPLVFLPQVVPDICDQLLDSHLGHNFGLYMTNFKSGTPGLRRGAFAQPGERGHIVMSGKCLATAAVCCVLAIPSAFAQHKPGPAEAARTTAGSAGGEQAAVSGLAPAQRSGRDPDAWSQQDIELARARCAVLLKNLPVVTMPSTRSAKAPNAARPHRCGSSALAAAPRWRCPRPRLSRATWSRRSIDGWSATYSRWHGSISAPR